MRIYQNPAEAFRETERDLSEMGIEVRVQSMQDKVVIDNDDYVTKEVQGYAFKIDKWRFHVPTAMTALLTINKGDDGQAAHTMMQYIRAEFDDRVGGIPLNPGNSYKARTEVWNEFLHHGRFAYTYSERLSPQLLRVMQELKEKPDTRQAILNIHSYIGAISDYLDGQPEAVATTTDFSRMGGVGRIPCSMYYQVMIRNGLVDLIYTMRSCDFLTHFPIDVLLALRLQTWIADQLKLGVGTFTYFAGSLHAYRKDLKVRGIF